MQRLIYFLIFGSSVVQFSCGKKLSDTEKKNILGITTMSDLATVEYTLSKIVKVNDKTAWYKVGDRKIAMSVMAYAKAGIDLSKITAEQITKTNGTLTIQIPPAKQISLSIPPEEIKEEMTEIDALRTSFTNEEKNELLKQAEVAIQKNLDSIGILNKAEQNAKTFITKFVADLGFNKVTVVVNPQLK